MGLPPPDTHCWGSISIDAELAMRDPRLQNLSEVLLHMVSYHVSVWHFQLVRGAIVSEESERG